MSGYLLHTDALERKYGPIRVVVTRHDPAAREGERIRKAKLIDGSGIMRTYALTFLNSDGRDEELNSSDEDIIAHTAVLNLGVKKQERRRFCMEPLWKSTVQISLLQGLTERVWMTRF